ncbi:hypothetical protein Vafri_19145 [Volvox africanus]|uniref:Uncharacterized protein n=1 Tax=Volvox africanus TaxID=51714 RepID=A0A8J4FBU5_9CHLO|nr:hypothetical protein Vafri_19145 [Volvox africanus]
MIPKAPKALPPSVSAVAVAPEGGELETCRRSTGAAAASSGVGAPHATFGGVCTWWDSRLWELVLSASCSWSGGQVAAANSDGSSATCKLANILCAAHAWPIASSPGASRALLPRNIRPDPPRPAGPPAPAEAAARRHSAPTG